MTTMIQTSAASPGKLNDILMLLLSSYYIIHTWEHGPLGITSKEELSTVLSNNATPPLPERGRF